MKYLIASISVWGLYFSSFVESLVKVSAKVSALLPLLQSISLVFAIIVSAITIFNFSVKSLRWGFRTINKIFKK